MNIPLKTIANTRLQEEFTHFNQDYVTIKADRVSRLLILNAKAQEQEVKGEQIP